ncbi:aminotransferase class I/II-fold pyridoxal phosphate-dependent enzyme [Acidaminobacter sp. JC074]|uniref:aminotransferase class I/II-fold pyridoxal phosphate-dependent enzyme n=1 Tax=Acidaminobacter sp. JC074 TaxID=2530199 RepID=UPI001F0DF767|nr:aminotransferase class I/II-fold pyridoxal phosphate-dependent enzyme [Acidaminobacter sp. JC074]MCH4890810.1 aminotransferase class I/II-fold pyridoxal phosphate-dependent enzyme [Acidaminobacter sp. JC074]
MKHKYISKKYWKDMSTPMGAVDELAKMYDDVINLSLGDPDMTTPGPIIDYAFEQAHLGHTKYTDFRGDPELRLAIADDYKESFGVSIDDKEIMVTASACLGMYLSLEAILDPGDEVLIHAPYFTPYPQQIQLAGGVPVEVATYEENDFQLVLEDLEAAVTERTKAMIINSPNNPSGTVFNIDTLKVISEIARKYDLLIISDEIYGAYTFKDKFVSLIEFEEIRDRLIILNSFSKDYTMTGWRVGNIIGPDYIVETCQMINENVVFTAPSISQRAAIYALKHKRELQPEMVSLYKSRVLKAYDLIQNIPWMSVLEPKGTFYLFINIKKTGKTSEEVSKIILEEAKVLTIPGNAFGKCGEGYVRIACTVDENTLEKAFKRISQIKLG